MLEIQVLRRFHLVGGIGSIIEAQILNSSPQPFSHLKITLKSTNGLLNPVSFGIEYLEPGQASLKTLEVLPARAGNYNWEWELTSQSPSNPFHYSGQQSATVYSEETIRQVTFNIDVQNSKSSAEKANMGAVQEIGDVHIHDLIREGAIKNVNDFIRHERDDATWEAITLINSPITPVAVTPSPRQSLHSQNTSTSSHPDHWGQKENKVGRFFRKLFDDPS